MKPKILTNKAIDKHCKAKGLQKLKWFCQMCEKQFRDQNAFKCHCEGEPHQRKLLLFAENPDKFIDDFSTEFLNNFIKVLSRQFGTKRILANHVYQEYITDREHIHMNATKWETLTDFTVWLGKNGYCIVEESEKGFYITYIDRSPEALKRIQLVKNREKNQLDDQERLEKYIEKRIKIDQEIASTKDENHDEESNQPVVTVSDVTNNSSIPISFQIKSTLSNSKVIANKASNLTTNIFNNPLKINITKSDSNKTLPSSNKNKRVIDELLEKDRIVDKDNYWLMENLIVKIIESSDASLINQKATIKKLIDKQHASLSLLNNPNEQTINHFHQSQLQTVLPILEKEVMIVRGTYRGCTAILKSISTEKSSLTVQVNQGAFQCKILNELSYDDVCKFLTK